MYEEYYDFTGNPFQATPDPRFFYASSGHQTALSYFDYGVERGEGFVVITGDVGAGKTSLLSQYLPALKDKAVIASRMQSTQVEPVEALRIALEGFGIKPFRKDKPSLLKAFNKFLQKQHKQKKRVLLIVDEVQNLPNETLEEIRMLANMDMEGEPVFQCFLVGQPQFLKTLNHPDMEQLRQRVIASFHLGPLSDEETRQYIEHRLRAVDWRGTPRITKDAYHEIYEVTGGIPRWINNVSNRLLLLGAIEKLAELDKEHVENVVADMANEVTGTPLSPGRKSANNTEEQDHSLTTSDETTTGATLDKRTAELLGKKLDSIHDQLSQQNDYLEKILSVLETQNTKKEESSSLPEEIVEELKKAAQAIQDMASGGGGTAKPAATAKKASDATAAKKPTAVKKAVIDDDTPITELEDHHEAAALPEKKARFT